MDRCSVTKIQVGKILNYITQLFKGSLIADCFIKNNICRKTYIIYMYERWAGVCETGQHGHR